MSSALQERLASDYQQMVNLKEQSDILDFTALSGTVPHVTEYSVTVNLKTYVGEGSMRDRHELRIQLPPQYPASPPEVLMVTSPPPFHPNWWPNGKLCLNSGSWNPAESLGQLMVRALKVMSFDPEVTATYSSANGQAKSWYNRNGNKFPLRQINLDPDKKKTFRLMDEPPDPGKTFRFV